jgi:type IV secretion system protein VirB1
MILLTFYLHHCANNIAPNTIKALIYTESKGNPLAIGINRGHYLRYQPHNLSQAINWVTYLEHNHYNFDIGLGQININNVHKYGYTAKDALNPCINISLMSNILHDIYHKALSVSLNKQQALYKTFSAYNSGNYHSGFYNGYIQRVIHNAQ